MPPEPSRESDLVAAVDDRVGRETRHHLPSASSVWITSLAIGAATVAPNAALGPRDSHRDRHLRVVGRREADEPRLVEAGAGCADRAVPVLPAT